MRGTGTATTVGEAVASRGARNSPPAGALERIVLRDGVIVAVELAGIAGLAWTYLVHMAHGMSVDMAMPHLHAWSRVDLLLLFLMWAVIMVAMMLPSAGPMILAFASVQRRRRGRRRPYVNTADRPRCAWMSRIAGVVLAMAGLWMLAAALK